jgi:hypothetical protein
MQPHRPGLPQKGDPPRPQRQITLSRDQSSATPAAAASSAALNAPPAPSRIRSHRLEAVMGCTRLDQAQLGRRLVALTLPVAAMVSDQATKLWRCAADHSRDKPSWLGLLATSVVQSEMPGCKGRLFLPHGRPGEPAFVRRCWCCSSSCSRCTCTRFPLRDLACSRQRLRELRSDDRRGLRRGCGLEILVMTASASSTSSVRSAPSSSSDRTRSRLGRCLSRLPSGGSTSDIRSSCSSTSAWTIRRVGRASARSARRCGTSQSSGSSSCLAARPALG